MIAASLTGASACAASVCSDRILENPKESRRLFKKFEIALMKEIFPQLKKFGWKPKKIRISAQNMPDALHRIAPRYMIRVDLKPVRPGADSAVLRNKMVLTPLRINTYPTQDRAGCKLVLQTRDQEDLVNQHDVPMPIHVFLDVKAEDTIELKPDPATPESYGPQVQS